MASIVYLGLLLFTLLHADLIAAQATAWSQCGGIGWTGATTCVAEYTCTESSAYYSQCIPSTATTSVASGTATSTSPMATGSQIRTVQDPVYHFYLQNIDGAPKLGPESSSGYFTIGSTIALNSVSGSSLYLNVNTSATTSYKPLSLDATATTTDWGLEGDTIITTNPRQLNFIACSTSNTTIYDVYLQNGNDTPSGTTCTLVTMHLPCLC